MFGSFLPSPWSSTNHSLLRSKEPTLLCNQIDAMEASAVDPYKFLVATRILACIVMLPLLTLVADLCGIFFGWVTNTLSDPISIRLFINSGFKNMTFNDLLPPTFKTAVFGLIIGLVGCFQGMRAHGGKRRAARCHQFCGPIFLIHHSRGCGACPADPGVLPMKTTTEVKPSGPPIQVKGCESPSANREC